MIRSIMSVGGLTLLSRITGFARDIVLASFLGAGLVADAFVVAQRLPNHLRSIFGEGAFNSAFVPAYSREMAIHGSAKAQNFAGKILSVLVATLTILSIFALWQMPLVIELLAPGFSNDPNKYALTIELTRITFPYLLLVSIVTLLSGVLNAHNRFASAAAAPILLNVSVVVFVGFAFLFPSAGHAAAWGVTIAGIFEILILLVNARRAGCLPKFQWPILDTSLRGFYRSLGPAVVSSGGIQIAMFADTILASLMPTGSVSAIYYADRIYQLPVGIIAVAAGTVLLPVMSKHLGVEDTAEAERAQNKVIGMTFALTLPFFVAFILIPDLIFDALFLHGAFTKEASLAASSVLSAYALGLIPIMLLRPVSYGFLARQDTYSPLIASVFGIGSNVFLKFLLYAEFGAAGLAYATAMGAWVTFAILGYLGFRKKYLRIDRSLIRIIFSTLISACILASFTYFMSSTIFNSIIYNEKLSAVLNLIALSVSGFVIYSTCFLIFIKMIFRSKIS